MEAVAIYGREHLRALSYRYADEPLIEKELERLRQSVNHQSPYGDLEWQGRVSKEFGLESTLGQRGRPRSGVEK